MPAEGWGIAWTVGSFMLGIVATLASVFINSRHTLQRERIARAATRGSTFQDRRDEFETTHLLDLHTAVADQYDAWIEMTHSRGRRATLRGGDPHSEQESQSNPELDQELTAEVAELAPRLDDAERRIRRLAGLVLDDEVRGYVRDYLTDLNRFHSHYSEMPLPEMLEQADAIAGKLQALREVIAARLRHVYTGVRPRGI
ncbi:hypothetical protein [Streptomyces griseoaurantiacus]|uniref:hypothetical protein n=1 Tax=Streptomyces griseoaurantiacus TaxID=68213 RepID=UPI00362AEAB7